MHYGVIHSNTNEIIPATILPFINDSSIPKKYTIAIPGDLFLADTSEDRIDCGKGIEIDGLSNHEVVGGLHTIHIRETRSLFVPFYKALFTRSNIFHKFAYKYSEGIKVFSLKPSLFKFLDFYYPEKLEQQKIVDLFVDLDTKITLVEQKIETLKKYKKGIVQQLLNSLAKSSLISLDKLCQITTGKLDANAQVDKGKYKFFTCAREDFLIDTYAFDTEAILVSGNGEVGLTKYYKGKFNAYQRTYVLFDFILNPLYLKTCIDSQINKVIRKETNRGTMPYIKLSTFSKIEIPMISKEESNNIGALIATLDSKINCLDLIMSTIKKIKNFFLSNLFI